MGRLHNYRHELFALALAESKSRSEAMVAAGYPFHRGNQNRLAKKLDIIRRVEEIRQAAEEIVDLRNKDRGRILLELARIAFADESARAAIAADGPDAVPANQRVLHITVRLEGALAKHIEMRLLDDRGAMTALLRDDSDPRRPSILNFGKSASPDWIGLEQGLRVILRDREANHGGTRL